MERNMPHTSTSGLLSWSDMPLPAYSSSANCSHLPSDGMSKVLGGDQITNEETKSLNKNVSYRRNCYDCKVKEMTGNGIFSVSETPNYKTRLHYHQSQISFGSEKTVSPKKKPIALTEAAKQQELSVTLQSKVDIKSKKKQMSSIKTKDINVHSSLFAAQQEVKENRVMEEPTPKKVTNLVGGQNKNFHKLTSNGIFKDDTFPPPGCVQKQQSSAKLQEMSGNDIFADGISEYRDYFGGIRRPPGGQSSLSLV